MGNSPAMNLEFQNVQIVNRDGADFMLQRFWITWRSPAGQEALKKLIYINKECLKSSPNAHPSKARNNNAHI